LIVWSKSHLQMHSMGWQPLPTRRLPQRLSCATAGSAELIAVSSLFTYDIYR
jgi:hypothetical protein